MKFNTLKISALLFVISVLTRPALSSEYEAFTTMAITPNSTIAEESVAKNLPRTYSQDAFGNCFAMSAGFILDADNCKTLSAEAVRINKPMEKDSCKSLPDKMSFSRLDLARYGDIVPDQKILRKDYGGIYEGGSAKYILNNILSYRLPIINQECASLDKALTKFDNVNDLSKAQSRGWSLLRQTYDKYKAQAKCPKCQLDTISTAMPELLQNFNISKSNEEILRIFSLESYDKFLDKLLIPPECSDSTIKLFNAQAKEIYMYPDEPYRISNYEENIDTIKKVLAKDIPLAVNNVCLGANFNAQQTKDKFMAAKPGEGIHSSSQNNVNKTQQGLCTDQHSVVITGYRNICKKDNPTDCRQSLKIENSWGKQWQDKHNDGWIDAKLFLDRTAYIGQNLLWIDEKNRN